MQKGLGVVLVDVEVLIFRPELRRFVLFHWWLWRWVLCWRHDGDEGRFCQPPLHDIRCR